MFAWDGGLPCWRSRLLRFLKPDATHDVGQLNPIGYSHYGLVAACVMFSAILFSLRYASLYSGIPHAAARRVRFCNTRKRCSPRSHRTLLHPAGFRHMHRHGNRPRLRPDLLHLHVLLDPHQQIARSPAMDHRRAIAFMISLPLSKRFGKKWPAIALFALGLAGGMTPMLLWLAGILPSPSLTSSAEPDRRDAYFDHADHREHNTSDVDADRCRGRQRTTTGRRSEGAFFASSSFIQKSVSGLGIFFSSAVLWLAQFPRNAVPGTIGHAALVRFSAIYLFAVIGLYSVALVFAAFYESRARITSRI